MAAKAELFEIKFTPHEVNVLLQLLANACDSERTDTSQRQVGTWIAERLLRVKADHEHG